MKIIIPAKQLTSRDFSTDIVVDNVFDKVEVTQYIVNKKVELDEDDKPITQTSEEVNADNSIFLKDNFYDKGFANKVRMRVEAFYTKGQLVIVPNKNITKVLKATSSVSGNLYDTQFNDTNKGFSDSRWSSSSAVDFSSYYKNSSPVGFYEDLTNPYLKSGSKYPTLHIDKLNTITITNRTNAQGNDEIVIDYEILTKTCEYKLNLSSGGGIINENLLRVYDGKTFVFELEAEGIHIEQDTTAQSKFGQGNNIYYLDDNELYQVGNTYNGVSMAEHNANEIIKRYKNGVKISSLSAKVKNLKTQSGYTLERQSIEPQDTIIPYYINKYNKEVPFSVNDNGEDMSFIVSSSEVNYDRVLTQNVECYEKTYFDLEYGNFILVSENGKALTTSDSVYKGDTVTINLTENAFENEKTYLDYAISINNNIYNLSSNAFDYSVLGDTSIFAILFSPLANTSFSVSTSLLQQQDFNSRGEAHTLFDSVNTLADDVPIKFSLTVTVADKNNNTNTKTITSDFYYRTNQKIYIKNIIDGENYLNIHIDLSYANKKWVDIVFSNSSNYKFTSIKLNSINQGVVLE